MNFIVRKLIDLFEALIRWYYSWRYGLVARRLGTSGGEQRGFIVVQIDGLSHDVLLEAISSGHAPYIAQILGSGEGEAYRWYSGLPSTTPAVQADLMYGTREGIPGFRWYEKATGQSPVCKLPGFLHQIQARISAGRPGILEGGASYTNMFDGGAPTSLFTLASIGQAGLLQRAGVLPLFLVFGFSPLRLARVIVLSVWTYLSELWRRVSAVFWPSKFGQLSLFSPFVHVATDVVVREISTFGALVDVYRGVPAVYINYSSYDEWAHRFGPSDGHALRAVRAIDGQVRQLDRMRRWGGRPYDLYVLSDHGMTACVPFQTAFGQSLGEFVDESIEAPTLTDESYLGPTDLQDAAALLGYETAAVEDGLEGLPQGALRTLRQSLEKRVENETAPRTDRTDIVVRNSGPLSHVYFNVVSDRPALLEELAAIFPGLVRRIADHPGISLVAVRGADGPMLITADGAYPCRPGAGEEAFEGLADAAELVTEMAALLSYPNSGDLVTLGRWGFWGRPDQVVSFERQRGTHGGAGGQQCYPFLVGVTHADMGLEHVHRANDIYRLLLSYRNPEETDGPTPVPLTRKVASRVGATSLGEAYPDNTGGGASAAPDGAARSWES